MNYYVYILRCQDNSLYTGWTTDVKARFTRHLHGKGAKYTRAHPPLHVVYTESFLTKSEAMKREYAIKQLNHQEKERLIATYEKEN